MNKLYIVEWLVKHYDHGDILHNSLVIYDDETELWHEYQDSNIDDMLIFYSKSLLLKDFIYKDRVNLTYIGEI